MARLYELTDAYISLLAQYEDAETEAEREQILQSLLECEGDIADKAESYARIVKNLDADVNAYEAELKRLRSKKAAAENAITRMKEYLKYSMEIAGATEIKTSIGKWKIQKNPFSVIINDLSKIPARFLIQKEPDVDRRGILAEFKETGEIFEGAEIVQTEGVRFR